MKIEDIEVPEFMLDAAMTVGLKVSETMWDHRKRVLAAALLALSENPIVPSDEQDEAMDRAWLRSPANGMRPTKFGAAEWQRRMFLRPTPALPESVKALMFQAASETMTTYCSTADDRIAQAYALGLAAKEPK